MGEIKTAFAGSVRPFNRILKLTVFDLGSLVISIHIITLLLFCCISLTALTDEIFYKKSIGKN
jgi:hypothetical protein